MAVISIQLSPRPLGEDEIRVDDMDTLMDENTCSCSSGDDNPN